MGNDTNINANKIIGVGVMTGGTVIQNIYNENETPDKGDNLTIQERQEEIESYIISNDLSTAIELLKELASNISKRLRREAILHESELNTINEELRKFGQSSDLDMRLKRLKTALLEFLDILGNG